MAGNPSHPRRPWVRGGRRQVRGTRPAGSVVWGSCSWRPRSVGSWVPVVRCRARICSGAGSRSVSMRAGAAEPAYPARSGPATSTVRIRRHGSAGIGRGAELTFAWRSTFGAGFALPRDADRRSAFQAVPALLLGRRYGVSAATRAMPVGDPHRENWPAFQLGIRGGVRLVGAVTGTGKHTLGGVSARLGV